MAKQIINYSLKENQIGCGYCFKESTCKIRNPRVNKAKEGCQEFNHFENINNGKKINKT